MNDNPNIGHNRPDENTAFDDLQERANALKTVGGKWLDAEDRKVIADQPMADKLTTFLKQCQQLRTASTKQKKADKQPSLDEGRRIEKLYTDLVAIVTKLEGALKPRLTAFEIEKQRVIQAERDEAKRVEDEKIAEAELAAQRAQQGDQSLENIEAAEEAQQAADAATEERKETETRDTATRDVVGGRRSGLKKTLSAEITDYAATLAHYANTPTIKDALQGLANNSARGIGVDQAVEGEEVCPGAIMKITQSV